MALELCTQNMHTKFGVIWTLGKKVMFRTSKIVKGEEL